MFTRIYLKCGAHLPVAPQRVLRRLTIATGPLWNDRSVARHQPQPTVEFHGEASFSPGGGGSVAIKPKGTRSWWEVFGAGQVTQIEVFEETSALGHSYIIRNRYYCPRCGTFDNEPRGVAGFICPHCG